MTPATTFNASTGTIADRYIKPVTIEVPGVAGGSSATFVFRAWQTSAGSYDAAVSKGQSAPVTIAALGGAGNPPSTPAFLVGLQGFTIGLPEPSVIALGVLGGAAFLLCRRK